MLGNMENLNIVSSFHKESKPFNKVQKRSYHAFIFKTKGYADFVFPERRLRVSAGEVIFLPQGSEYEATTHAVGGNLYTSINFYADIDNPVASVYPFESFPGAVYMAENFSELWRFGGLPERYKCLSLFYDFLSYISRLEQMGSPAERKLSLIEPAMEYLKKHIYDSDFKVDKLHRLCGISDTYFRKIFENEFNMTPREYIAAQRVSHARSIIESGDFDSIKEVSELVGYNDPLYFSKVFRKFYGISPGRINKR